MAKATEVDALGRRRRRCRPAAEHVMPPGGDAALIEQQQRARPMAGICASAASDASKASARLVVSELRDDARGAGHEGSNRPRRRRLHTTFHVSAAAGGVAASRRMSTTISVAVNATGGAAEPVVPEKATAVPTVECTVGAADQRGLDGRLGEARQLRRHGVNKGRRRVEASRQHPAVRPAAVGPTAVTSSHGRRR